MKHKPYWFYLRMLNAGKKIAEDFSKTEPRFISIHIQVEMKKSAYTLEKD